MQNISDRIRNHRLYPFYIQIHNRLAAHHFVCWLTGGAVRDFLLNRKVKDFDLVTDAHTQVLKILFPEAILVGEQFGVLKIPVKSIDSGHLENIEIIEFIELSTFREESDYKDGRRPSQTRASTPFADAKRRDFTVNSLFWSKNLNAVIDFLGGVADLQSEHLCAVGDPNIRFQEDHLRILRFIRFGASLDFKLDHQTLVAAQSLVKTIDFVSGERIWDEFKKLGHSKEWQKLLEIDLFYLLMEQVFKLTPKSILNKKIKDAQNKLFILMYVLCELFDQDISDLLLKRLKISRAEKKLYNSFFYLTNLDTQYAAEELAVDLEESQELYEVYKYLVDVQHFNFETQQKINLYLEKSPEAFISKKELSLVVPHHLVGDEHRSIRIKQFNGEYKTKAQVVEILNEKYAK